MSVVQIPAVLSLTTYDSAALQFAVASGATVIATSSSDDKLKAAKQLGAKLVINYKSNPRWSEAVLELVRLASLAVFEG